MVAAEADVVLFELDGPEGGVKFAVLVFTVHVDAPHKAHEHYHQHNDDRQDDDVELGPGHLTDSGGCGHVLTGTGQSGQDSTGGGGGQQRGEVGSRHGRHGGG